MIVGLPGQGKAKARIGLILPVSGRNDMRPISGPSCVVLIAGEM
jgi:hypothetical protein